jgi:hypothetical protein
MDQCGIFKVVRQLVVPGLAYTPVYFAYMFVAVLLAVLAYLAVRRIPRGFGRYVAALIGAFVIALTYQANAFAMSRYAGWNMTVPQALHAGLLRGIPDGATVYLDTSYPAHRMTKAPGTWNTQYYLYYYTHRRLVALPIDALTADSATDAFVVLGSTAGFQRGVTIGARVAAVTQSGKTLVPLIRSANRYVRSARGEGTLTSWVSRCGPVPAQSELEGSPSGTVLNFLGPFYPEERYEPDRFRWSSGAATLQIDTPTSRAHTVRLQFDVRPIDANTHVRIEAQGIRFARSADGTDTPVSVSLRLAAHRHVDFRFRSNDRPQTRPPDTRALLYQVRDWRILEQGC